MKADPYETAVMRQCQRGVRYPNGSGTGSFCRKRDLCRADGHCHFVTQVERHLTRVWTTMPGRIMWSFRVDDEVAD